MTFMNGSSFSFGQFIIRRDVKNFSANIKIHICHWILRSVSPFHSYTDKILNAYI